MKSIRFNRFTAISTPFLTLIICISCIGLSSFSVAQDKTEITAYINHIPDLEPPIIDGFLDDPVWEYTTQGRVSQNSDGWYVRSNPNYPVDDPVQTGVLSGQRDGDRPDDNADASFRVWTVYDDEYLYIAVAALDFDFVNRLPSDSVNGETWYEDSVEVFIDGNHNRLPGNVNDSPAEYETGGQFVITSNGAIRHQEAGNPTFGDTPDADWYAVVGINDSGDGFDYEFRIKLSKIGNPVPGSVIGFNIAMNDADDPNAATADYQLLWTGQAHQESTYGNLEFGRRSITAPLITEAVTIDGLMGESSWAVAGKGKGGVPHGPFTGDTKPKNTDDLSFDLYVMHDTDYLYVAVDVKDEEVIADTEETGAEDGYTWYDDSVEVFIDGNHNHVPGNTNETGFLRGGQLVITANNAFRDANAAATGEVFYGPAAEDSWYALTTLTPAGYLAEFRIKKADMFDPTDIDTIGFEIALNEDDADPVEEKDTGFQIKWNGQVHNEASYGDLIFGGPVTPLIEWEIY